MAQFVVTGITLAGGGLLPAMGCREAARYCLAAGLGIRRRYRACRVVLMPAARSVSSVQTIISSQRVERRPTPLSRDASMRA
jgi:hypothetical protein